jgi:DNA-binding NarL/FixJ family response regulator
VETTNNKQSALENPLIRVLVVDRHQIVRRGIGREIDKAADLSLVGEASDGNEAIKLANELLPDVITLDASLPRLSGVQVIRQLKSGRPKSRTPGVNAPAVLVLSAYSDKQYIWSLLASGANGYLLKDEPVSDILAAIRRIARGQAALSVAVQTTLVELIQTLSQELSATELKVLTLVAQGMTNKEIARTLAIAEGTVKIHLNNTYRKVPLIRTRAEATAWAWINRMVSE